jgi:hypothetical protein
MARKHLPEDIKGRLLQINDMFFFLASFQHTYCDIRPNFTGQ